MTAPAPAPAPAPAASLTALFAGWMNADPRTNAFTVTADRAAGTALPLAVVAEHVAAATVRAGRSGRSRGTVEAQVDTWIADDDPAEPGLAWALLDVLGRSRPPVLVQDRVLHRVRAEIAGRVHDETDRTVRLVVRVFADWHLPGV